MLRRYSNIAMAVAFVAWLGSATSAYLGHPALAKALVVAFVASGFVAAGAWCIHCLMVSWRWLQGRTRGP